MNGYLIYGFLSQQTETQATGMTQQGLGEPGSLLCVLMEPRVVSENREVYFA